MAKLMLVIDDYKELTYAERLLKRMGFDVMSFNRESSVGDALLSFFPDLLIASYKGQSIDGLRLATKQKRQAPNSKVLLLLQQGQSPQLTPEQRSKIDALIDLPLQPHDVLFVIAQLLRLNAETLLDKFEKLTRAQTAEKGDEILILKNDERGAPRLDRRVVSGGEIKREENQMVQSGARDAVVAEKTERERGYDLILAALKEPVDKVIPHARITKHIDELTKATLGEADSLRELQEKKREFVRALMKKPKS